MPGPVTVPVTVTITGEAIGNLLPSDLASLSERALLVAIYRRLLIMPTQDELQAALDTVKSDVSTVGSRLGAQIQALEDAQAAGQQVPQAVLDELGAIHTALTDPTFGEPAAPAAPTDPAAPPAQ